MNLAQVFKENGIQYAHIVDDAFDEVPQTTLDRPAIETFLSSCGSGEFDSLCETLGIPGRSEDDVIAELETTDGIEKLYKSRDRFGEHAILLFESFTFHRISQQESLKPLLELLNSLSIVVETFGANYDGSSKNEPQILFVDFKLNDKDVLIEEPLQVLSRLKEHHPNCNPLVFLMSTLRQALDERREEFRERGKLFSTQFETLPKEMFQHPERLGLFLKHHAKVFPHLVTLNSHAEAWGTSLELAGEKVKETLRKLDLADYFILYRNTAMDEKVSLGTYITDLLLEYTSYEIEGSNQIWECAKHLSEWEIQGLTRSRFNLTPAVADIYSSNVLHSLSRLKAEKELGISPLQLGTIFFPRKEIKQGAEALVILSPVCDLARPEQIYEGKRSVFLCCGEIEEVKPTTIPKDQEHATVIIRYPSDSTKQYIIRWDKKKLRIWDQNDANKLDDPNSEWIPVARMRPLFALQLQHVITSDLSRVGVQRRPDILRPYGVEVLVAHNGRWKELKVGFKDKAEAGAISEAKGTCKAIYILSDDLMRKTYDKLTQWIETNPTLEASSILKKIFSIDDIDHALMYVTHEWTEGECNIDDILPLKNMGSLSSDEQGAVIFADQRGEHRKKYGGGKNIPPEEKAKLVFRFVKVDGHTAN